jgi:glucose/arabinose dehydrogenase
MKRVSIVPASVAMVCALFLPARVDVSTASLQQPIDSVQLEPVVTGLSAPIFVTNARDGSGRLFIVEQGGRIKVLQPGQSSPTVFLNIASRVLSGGERGLLGLTFHPQYRSNRRFFVNYTRTPDGATVIAEYRVSASNPDVAEATESVLLTIAQPFANHNGGMVEFGPDGYLYIGMGDGGSGNDPGNRAQNVNELLGKILRIDVDVPSGGTPYSSPPTNPFFGSIPGRAEIYALGLRNPWRFSFDRTTGELYLGDVGQNAREEIDIITLGGNYGWRVFEGTRCANDTALCNRSNYTSPIGEYDNTARSGGRCSVTGGYVYRGSRSSLPTGAYIFGDYCTGEIFMLESGVQSLLLDTNLNISSFGEDENGEIYVVGLGGTVQRLFSNVVPPPPPPPPPTFGLESVIVRRRSSGEILEPVTIKNNGKKFEVVVRGQDFPDGSAILVNGREMKTDPGNPANRELIARLRRGTLSEAGPLVVEVATPSGARSNQVTIQVGSG